MKNQYKNNPIILVLMVASLIINAILIGDIVIVEKNLSEKNKNIKELESKIQSANKMISSLNPLLTDGEIIDEDHSREIQEIDYSTFKEYLSSNKNAIVMLGYDGCIWCQRQVPVLSMAMYKYDVDVNYLDISKISADERKEINTLHNDLAKYGTPTFIKIENNKVVMVTSGAKTMNGLETMFRNMGMLGE